jgi:hypothetical protein
MKPGQESGKRDGARGPVGAELRALSENSTSEKTGVLFSLTAHGLPSGPDILIQPEQVRRIVLPLELHQPLVV